MSDEYVAARFVGQGVDHLIGVEFTGSTVTIFLDGAVVMTIDRPRQRWWTRASEWLRRAIQ